MSRRMRSAVVLATGAAVAALGLAAEWIAYGPDGWKTDGVGAVHPWMLDLATGYVFLAAGIMGALRRPGSLIGPLFILTAASWLVATLIEPPRFVGTAVSPSLVFLYRGFLAHAIITFPTGRPADRVEGAAVMVGYAAAVLAPLSYSPAAGVMLVALLVAVAWRSKRRALGRSRPARRDALGAAVLLAASVVVVTAGRYVDAPYPFADALVISFHLVLMAVAVRLSLQLVRSERPDLTDLVVELGEGGAQRTLREELARLLGDPAVAIGRWSARRHAWLDDSGQLMADGEPSGQAEVRIERAGEPLALVRLDPGTLDDPEVRDAVADAVRLWVSNDRLRREVEAQVTELAASRRRLIVTGDAEGERLVRRLREGAIRHLRTVGGHLEAAEQRSRSAGVTTVSIALNRARQRLARVEDDLADFAQGLDPRRLAQTSLADALTDLARDCTIAVELRMDVEPVSPELATEAYLVCAEALANATKHSNATLVQMDVERVHDAVVLTVTDDGIGGASIGGGSGLRGLADRAESLGGSLVLRSEPGRGTQLVATLPMPRIAAMPVPAMAVESRSNGRANSPVSTDVQAPARSYCRMVHSPMEERS